MDKSIKIGRYNFNFVFKHKWNKDNLFEFKKYMLGVWFRKDKMVNHKHIGKIKQWDKNLINLYKFGINLLVCEFWISFHR